jgi:polyhydroxyalkanoate synthesis regulator phasin
MEVTSYTLEDVIQEVRERAETEVVGTQSAWNEIVEEVIEDHVDLGQIDSDQNTEQWKEVVQHMWKDYRLERAVEEGESEE